MCGHGFGIVSAENRHLLSFNLNELIGQATMAQLCKTSVVNQRLANAVYVCSLCQSSRSFKSSSSLGARPAKSPLVSSKERAKRSQPSRPHPSPLLGDGFKVFWPISLFKAGKASGALQIEPDDAVSFLNSFGGLNGARFEPTEKLCRGASPRIPPPVPTDSSQTMGSSL